jgi:hypothetical protein
MVNGEENIVLTGGDTLYLTTGISPVGANFKVNKCSGYLNQFQDFVPSLNTNCPRPRDENLSSIPNTNTNDECLNYIDNFSSCRIQTDPLPQKWSYECTTFIKDKIGYPSCVTTHKNDKDFQLPEWRAYLQRSDSIWKTTRDAIVLYDNEGKVVDSTRF